MLPVKKLNKTVNIGKSSVRPLQLIVSASSETRVPMFAAIVRLRRSMPPSLRFKGLPAAIQFGDIVDVNLYGADCNRRQLRDQDVPVRRVLKYQRGVRQLKPE